jgi:hypothetical protein
MSTLSIVRISSAWSGLQYSIGLSPGTLRLSPTTAWLLKTEAVAGARATDKTAIAVENLIMAAFPSQRDSVQEEVNGGLEGG